MKLFPPFESWSAKIRNPDAFRAFVLRWNTENHHGLTGEVKEDFTFQLSRKINVTNSERPQIHGRIVVESGYQKVILHMESPKSLLIINLIMCGFILITTIYQQNWIGLWFVPFTFIFLYLFGYLGHVVERKSTQETIQELLKYAQEID